MNLFRCLTLLVVAMLVSVHAQESPAPAPKIGPLPAAKILFLGNSITLHGPAPEIGWTGNWGMAASRAENDYVHLLTASLGKLAGAKPEIMVRNIADFERGHTTFDIEQKLADQLKFEADLVIVAIGENVADLTTPEAQQHYTEAFARLLATLNRHGRPTIFVRSSFWSHPVKDGIMRKASEQAGVTFVDISSLGGDKANAASSERDFQHAGVAAHPGDQGMQAIANALLQSIRAKAGLPAKEGP